MRHERRTMEMNGKCHKIGRAAAAFVLSGAIMAAGGITAMAAGSAGTGTIAGTAVNPAEQGPGVPAASKAESEERRLQWRMGSYSPRIWKEQRMRTSWWW